MKTKSLNKIRQRIKFFDNFQKIANSIALISSIKFNRSYRKMHNIMRNVFYFLSLVHEIASRHNLDLTKFIARTKKGNRCLVIVISSDKGLAGAFDQIIFKKSESLIKFLQGQSQKIYLGVIGRKGETYFKKRLNLYFSFSNFENILPEDFAKELLTFINNILQEGIISEIYLIRPNLTSTGFLVEDLRLYPFDLQTLQDLLEIILPKMKEWQNLQKTSSFKWNFRYILEPSPEKLITTILNNIFFLLLYALILESQASLEFTRTITMKKANETAKELKEDESLRYNKLRQQKITEELLDITRT